MEDFSVVFWPPGDPRQRIETEFHRTEKGHFEIEGVPLGELLVYASSKDYPRSEVRAVYYPGLDSHPQHLLAGELFAAYGALLSFELDPRLDCFDFLNRLQHVVLSSNLGDNRTLAIPVAHTIFWEMGPGRRAEMGIAESLVRVSVGIEDSADLIADFGQALAA